MADSDKHDDTLRQAAAGCALILLQFAAAEAEIGPFARRGLETPRTAARRYEATSRLAANRRLGLA